MAPTYKKYTKKERLFTWWKFSCIPGVTTKEKVNIVKKWLIHVFYLFFINEQIRSYILTSWINLDCVSESFNKAPDTQH